MKEKLLLVMPMTLGVLLLTIVFMTGDIIVSNNPSVESTSLVSYNSQPIEEYNYAHVIDSKAANLSYGVTSGVGLDMSVSMPMVTKNDVVTTRSSYIEEPQLILNDPPKMVYRSTVVYPATTYPKRGIRK